MTGLQKDLRFAYPELELELAMVGHFLILVGSEEALAPFRETKATFRVDSLEEFRSYLTKNGARIIRGFKRVPTGSVFAGIGGAVLPAVTGYAMDHTSPAGVIGLIAGSTFLLLITLSAILLSERASRKAFDDRVSA